MSEPESAQAPLTGLDGDKAERDKAARAIPDLFLVALMVLALAKAWLSRALGLGAFNPGGLVFEVSAIVFLLGLIDLVTPRRSYALDLVWYSLLSLVMLGNVMYVSLFGEIVSPHLLSVAGQAGQVSDSIRAMLRPVYLLYVVDIPLLALWAALTFRARREGPRRRRRWVAVAAGVALLVLLAQVAFVLRLPADTDGATVATLRGFAPYQLGSIVRLGMPDPAAHAAAAFAHETTRTLTPAEAAQKQIDAIRHGQEGSRTVAFQPGAYRGKNVIILQVEALQDLVIGAKYDGKPVAPNLTALAKSSWYFPNTYSETSAGNTVDAEFSVNTSLLSPVDGASSVDYANRVLPGLPRLLRQAGYDAVTMHQNDVRFWNRKQLYPALGFRRWWDKSYFQNRDKMWHASDEAELSMVMPVLKSEDASTAPFYSFIITESSHAPFTTIPMNRRPLRLSAADEKTFSGRYIGSISYTDMAIGEFISALKKSGLWDDSILVVYGDHSALLDKGPNRGDSAVADDILGRRYSDVDRQRIPLIIHLPGQSAGQVSVKPAGQVDVMPTVADLVGLDLSQAPHVGRSLFVDSPALIPTRAYEPGGSFIDDNVLFMPGLSADDGRAVSVETDQPVQPTQAERDEYAVSRQLSLISDAWIKSLPIRPNAGSVKDAIIPGQ